MRASNKPLLFLLLAALVVAVAAGVLFLRRPATVVAMEIRPETIEEALSVVGRARPTQLVQVSSPNPGQVVRLLHDDGDQVAAGEPLAVILATVEQAQAEVDIAQARAAHACVRAVVCLAQRADHP